MYQYASYVLCDFLLVLLFLSVFENQRDLSLDGVLVYLTITTLSDSLGTISKGGMMLL